MGILAGLILILTALTRRYVLLIPVVILFGAYILFRTVPIIMIFGVLCWDCDPIKMKDVALHMERKEKNAGSVMMWKYIRALATYYISGCKEESFQLCESGGNVEKAFNSQLVYLSLYLNHYYDKQDWDNYKKIRMELNDLPKQYKTTKMGKEVYERYMKCVVAKECILSGDREKARELFQTVLESKDIHELNRVIICSQLATMDIDEGKYESAKAHLNFVIEHGGTTYFVDKAKEQVVEKFADCTVCD